MTPELILTVRRPPGVAVVYRFAEASVEVGREADCAVVLADPAVSGVHLRFARREGGYVVLDVGSAHGTRLQGRALAPHQPVAVGEGDTLQVGAFLIEVSVDSGGGLTTDSRDTSRIAEALAAELAAGQPAVFVTGGARAGHSVPLLAGSPLRVGSSPTAELSLPDDGVAPNHLELSRAPGGVIEGRTLDAPVRVQGQPLTGRFRLAPGDAIGVGTAQLSVTPGAGAAPPVRDAPATPTAPPGRWLETALLCGGVLALAAAIWLFLSG